MAEDRKARLAALSARAKRNTATDKNSDNAITDLEIETKVNDGSPNDRMLEPTNFTSVGSVSKRRKMGDDGKIGENKSSSLAEAIIEAKLEASKSSAQTLSGNEKKNTPMGVPSKKVNWDLKRDIQSTLDRLEKRTQRAIVSLLKERLEKEAENSEILVSENDID